MGIVLGFTLALIVPLLFLSLIYKFDFYQTGQFHIILKCLLWGGIACAPAIFTNWILGHFWLNNPDAIVQFAAPIYEEVFKGLILLYLFKRAKFTYSVDGALYGFAIGTGFAIVENFGYILGDLSEAPMVAAQRIFSANLQQCRVWNYAGIVSLENIQASMANSCCWIADSNRSAYGF